MMNQDSSVIFLVKGDNLGEEEEEQPGVKDNPRVLNLISQKDSWVMRENY